MSTPPGLTPEVEAQLLAFMRHEAENPQPAGDFLVIPANLPPMWTEFFGKIKRYADECCGEPHERITWEKRMWIMEDKKLDEFDMIMSSANMKDLGTKEFKKGNTEKAFMYYMTATRTFPNPSAMLNIALIANQDKRYKLAENMSTRAINTNLLTSGNKAKALFRRAKARKYMAKWLEALEDLTEAFKLQPTDPSIQSETVEVQRLIDTHTNKEAYLAKNPEPGPETMAEAAQLEEYTKIPAIVDMRLIKPPTY